MGAHRKAVPPDQGQAVPLVIGAVAVAATLVVGLGAVGRRAHEAARARTAADAAALAGVTGGSGAAARLASANGGMLVRFTDDGETVRVEVVVGSTRAQARAAVMPDAVPSSGSPLVRPRGADQPSAGRRITT